MTKLSDILVDPDLVGEAEYRALYEFLENVWNDLSIDDEDYSDEQKLNMVNSILNEFIGSAEAMKRRLKVWRNRRLV